MDFYVEVYMEFVYGCSCGCLYWFLHGIVYGFLHGFLYGSLHGFLYGFFYVCMNMPGKSCDFVSFVIQEKAPCKRAV